MKVSEFMNYVNAALNFPSIEINDIAVYLDMAIAELNTTLHTSIPPISEQLENYNKDVFKNTKLIALTVDPTADNTIYTTDGTETVPSNVKVYFNTATSKFYILERGNYVECSNFVGVYFRDGIKEYWAPFTYGNNPMWEITERDRTNSYNLEECMPHDWIMLWLIPYVCFKYTVRDGGSAQTFAEELTQGFQQLQDTYNIPEKVVLATYSDKPIYKDLVLKYLPNINIKVATRAIYEDMKHSRSVTSEFGSMYDRGGFND